MFKASIIGEGQIGSHLQERLVGLGWAVDSISHEKGRLAYDEVVDVSLRLHEPDVVFLAISTKDDGSAAANYIRSFIRRLGIPVVTCEKGALSNFDLRQQLPLLGYSAAVGGGTQMLRYLASRRPQDYPVEIESVLNGTLNYLFTQMQEGNTLAQACTQAKALHITEPGADDPLSIINGELRDVVMKACVLHNTELSSDELVRPDDFGVVALTEQELLMLSSHAGAYRMMVAFSSGREIPLGPFFLKGWGVKLRHWDIRLGFRHILNESEFDWLPGSVGNGLCITEGKFGIGGKYTLLGPGAGLEPTTTAMINDAYHLIKSRKWASRLREGAKALSA